MDIKDRLKEIRDYAKMGQTNFEKYTGISSGYFNKIKGSIGSDTILKIADKYPEINLDWLITGNGDMLKNNPGPSPNFQSGDKSINASYQGNFTEPIHTEINSGNNINSGNAIKRGKEKDNAIFQEFKDIEKELFKTQMKLEFLQEENERLKTMLSQVTSDKDKAMAMLEKLLSK